MAEKNSKELLQLEATTTSSSCLESKLFVCKKDRPFYRSEVPVEKPSMFALPKSQVFGKVMDFLGVISESNKKLLQDAKDNPENYDIEVLSGKESGVVEMDLMLGVADLHTPEAVAAAESAIAGNARMIPLAESSSESEDEDGRDDINGDDEEDMPSDQDDEAGSQAVKFASKGSKRDSSSRKHNPQKRSKIVELS